MNELFTEDINNLCKENDLLIGFFELFFVTISSLLYPIRLLGKITALDAISRD